MTISKASAEILTEARRYCANAGIKLSTLGAYAVGNNRIFARLEAGRDCHTATLDRIAQYMADHPPATPAREDAA